MCPQCQRGMNGDRSTCTRCRGYIPTTVPCERCGQRRVKLGGTVCGVCSRLSVRPHKSTRACVDCGAPCRAERCQTCAGFAHQAIPSVVIRWLLTNGWTTSEIAKKLRISRQRVHQIAHRYESRARALLNGAVERGEIMKPTACQRCEAFTPDLEAHHPDYDKALDVIWLCPRCHAVVHPHKRGSKNRDAVHA